MSKQLRHVWKKFKIAILLFLLFIATLLGLQFLPKHYPPTGASVTLVVNSCNDAKTGWTSVDPHPHLEGTGNGYVYTNTQAATVGDFGFQDTTETGTITSVYVKVYAKSDNVMSDNIRIYISDGATWTDKGTISTTQTYTWYSKDVTTQLNTWTKINAGMLYLKYEYISTPYTTYADAAKLEVTYTPPPPKPPQYSNVGYNNTVINKQTVFTCKWVNGSFSPALLDTAIFSWNGTAPYSWVNMTVWELAKVTNKWSNASKFLLTAFKKIGFKFYCKDTSGLWNATTTTAFTVSPLILRPNADGDINEWTGTYASVNDQSDSTYASTTAASKKSIYNLQDISNVASVSSIVVKNRACGGTSGWYYRITCRSGTDDYYSGDIYVSTSYQDFSYNITTLKTWTTSLINALQAGEYSVFTQTHYVSEVWVEVCYTLYDVTPPTIKLNLAGNKAEGNYTALSRQKENFLYVNATVTDNIYVIDVLLSWYSGTWTNYTMTRDYPKSFYWKNMTNQASGIDYTFKIYAYDIKNNLTSYTWKKPNVTQQYPAEVPWITKYCRLGYSLGDLAYKHYFYHYAGFYSSVVQAMPVLPHEQLVDYGGEDTGFLLEKRPTSTYTITCSQYIWFWMENNLTAEDTIDNVYWHLWWRAIPNSVSLIYMKNEERTGSLGGISKQESVTVTKTDKTFNNEQQNVTLGGVVYHLSGKRLITSLSVSVDDNDVYELGTALSGASGSYPQILEHPNMTSFIIFNLPSNATLQGLDTDNDEISDYAELFTYWTDPFDNDTDNDYMNDKWEIDNGFNPLLWTQVAADLSLRIKDWDLTDNIQGAKVYLDGALKISDPNGWANYTRPSGQNYIIKVSHLGYWINNSLILLDQDKIVDVKCKLHDGEAWIRDYENFTNIVDAPVKFYNSTNHELASGTTDANGKCSFTNLPNATLIFKVWRNNTLVFSGYTPVLTENIIFQKHVNISYCITNEWCPRAVFSTDIGKNLGQVNASLWSFVQYTAFVIEWTNGSRTVFMRGETWNVNVVLTADAKYIWTWTTQTGVWVHKYE